MWGRDSGSPLVVPGGGCYPRPGASRNGGSRPVHAACPPLGADPDRSAGAGTRPTGRRQSRRRAIGWSVRRKGASNQRRTTSRGASDSSTPVRSGFADRSVARRPWLGRSAGGHRGETEHHDRCEAAGGSPAGTRPASGSPHPALREHGTPAASHVRPRAVTPVVCSPLFGRPAGLGHGQGEARRRRLFQKS